MLVTNGTVHGLRLLLGVTRQPGDRIAIEDPGYLNAVAAAQDQRLTIVDVPVDEDGLRVSELDRRCDRGLRDARRTSTRSAAGYPLPDATS